MFDTRHLRQAARLCFLFVPWLLCFDTLAAETSPTGRSLSAAEQAEFRSQFERGESFYSAQNYEEAIKCFQLALAIKPDPNALYNIAQSHRRIGHYKLAKDYFEFFLRIPSDISVAERQKVEGFVAELGEKIREEEAAQQGFGKEEPPRRPTWRIGLGIVGIAAGATLMSFGGMLSSIHGQPGLINGKEDFTQVYDTKGVAAGLLTPGALFLVGGIVLLALPGEKRSPNATLPTATPKLSLGPVKSGVVLISPSGM